MNFACGEEYQKHTGEQLDENFWVKLRAGLSFVVGEAGRVWCGAQRMSSAGLGRPHFLTRVWMENGGLTDRARKLSPALSFTHIFTNSFL
jgi:hypothetical protein